MIAESRQKLQVFGRSRGLIVFRFNFRKVQRDGPDDGQETETMWYFEQVTINPPVERGRLIDAIIANRYSKSAEIALINNKDLSPEGADEYQKYQACRAQAKAWVKEAL